MTKGDEGGLDSLFQRAKVLPEYDIDQIREVIEGPYRIIYHIKPDQIDVLAVIHGAMDVLHLSEEKDD